MKSLYQFTLPQLQAELAAMGKPKFAAAQIYQWLYERFAQSFDTMTNLSKKDREELAAHFSFLPLERVDTSPGAGGETLKFLLKTHDEKFIECVLIYMDDADSEDGEGHITLCVSCQAGCPLGCGFCATGELGFERNLTVEEIIGQVVWAERALIESLGPPQKPGRRISNIVFMGMGEPLLNLGAVLPALEILNSGKGYNLGARHLTLSTAGIVPGIKELCKVTAQYRLAISLHAAFQDKRAGIMPVARTYPLSVLIPALKEYQEGASRRLTVEYILMEGLNMGEEDARELKSLLSGMDYHLNLIPYNTIPGKPYTAPADQSVYRFTGYLKKLGIPYVLRKSRGQDNKSACGQLGLYWKNLNKSAE